jgi:GNAT superfamily N-acetyltransferase
MSGASGLQILAAAESDIQILQALFVASSMSNEGDRANMVEHPEVLVFDGEGVSEGRTRVAVDDGEIVGFSTYVVAPDFMEVEDLFVQPGRMRGGVGRALIGDLVEIARSKSAPYLEVTANPHALEFYEAVGFVAGESVETQFGPGIRMRMVVAS